MKRNWFQRGLSFLLALVLVFELAPTLVKANDDELEDDVIVEDINPGESSSVVIGEVTELREENIKHFRMEDGSYIAVDYGMPVHYTEDGETWIDIDNTLRFVAPGTAAAQMYVAENGTNTTSFAADFTPDCFLLSSESDGCRVTMSLLQEQTAVQMQDMYSNMSSDPAVENVEGDDVISDIVGATDEQPLVDNELVEPEANELEEDAELVAENADEYILDSEATLAESSEDDAAVMEATESMCSNEGGILDDVADPETEPATEPALIPAEVDSEEIPSDELLPEETIEEFPNYDIVEGVVYNPDEADAEENEDIADQVALPNLYSSIVYPDIIPNVDLKYDAFGWNVKESIILNARQNSYTYRFFLELEGLSPAQLDSGAISLVNDLGEEVFFIPAPYMIDDYGEVSDSVWYDVEEVDGGFLLTVTADSTWLDDADRAYPVTIDPALIRTSGGTVDDIVANFVYEAAPTRKYNGSQLYLGSHGTSGHTYKAYLYFSRLPSVPANCYVQRATVDLYKMNFEHIGMSEFYGEMHRVTSSRPSSYSSYTSWIYDLDWNHAPAYSSKVEDYQLLESTGNVGKYIEWDITETVKDWYATKTQDRVMALVPSYPSSLSGNNYANAAFYTFTNTCRPLFVVEYRNCNGLESYYTYQSVGLDDAGTAYIGDFSGQLTMSKNLFTFASTINPYSLDLIYNGSYYQRTKSNYDVGNAMGYGMHIGSGMQLNAMQKVEKVQITNELEASGTTTYIKYTDGDGTEHYFSKDPGKDQNYYYSEDGLQLRITEYTTDYFKMLDDQDTEIYFVHGFLTYIKDNNGNQIQFRYVPSPSNPNSWYPSTSGGRLDKIVQKNKDGSELTLARFAYTTYGSVSNYVDTITDYAGHVYSFDYINYKLRKVFRDGELIMQIGLKYDSTSNLFVDEVQYIYNPISHYGVGFTYDNNRVSSYYEMTSPSTGARPGHVVNVAQIGNEQTVYTDSGDDRVFGTDDDILTYYSYDYAGRSVNTYTTDYSGNVLGASNAVMSGTGTTDKQNNRTLRTSTIGTAGMNRLRNSSLETTTPAWTFNLDGSGTNIIRSADKPHSGVYGVKGWLAGGSTKTISATYTSDNLVAGKTYTLSAYVNTSECTGFNGNGVYLRVNGHGIDKSSNEINYKTSTSVDGGWVRLAVTFTPQSSGTYTFGVYNAGGTGIFYADDFQVEMATVPSNRNLLENGNMQYWGYGWTRSTNAQFVTGMGALTTDSNAYCIKMCGGPTREESASQTVAINQAGKTYVMSGWAKADAVPDTLTRATGDDAADKDKYKQFGLRAVIKYKNESALEYHYVPFNANLDSWQFVSTTIVPKYPAKVIESIQVICAYERNANTAYFDNISLVEEVAQTMRYDKDGNLISVKSTGNEEESANYKNGNLMTLNTGGEGTFKYTYDTTYKHRVVSSNNGVVEDKLSYDTSGNVTQSAVHQYTEGTTSAGSDIKTITQYNNSRNTISQTTAANGGVTKYTYTGSDSVMNGRPTSVTAPNNVTTNYSYDSYGHTTGTSISDSSLTYGYTNSILSQITRTAPRYDYTQRATVSVQQTYSMGHDAFGNLLSVNVGSKNLVTNTYAQKNGALLSQSLADGSETSYTYDSLGRTKTFTRPDGTVCEYEYNGDGQLYSLTESKDGTVLNHFVYNYDSIGRLIGYSQTGDATLRSAYTYDEHNRLHKWAYSIPGVIDNAEETVYYISNTERNVADGVISSMALFSNSWLHFRYDELARLDERDVGSTLTEKYTYASAGTNGTTTDISSIRVVPYGGSTVLFGADYTRNNTGYITGIADAIDGSQISYTYDNLGQLTKAVYAQADGSGTPVEYYYYYDGAGNITSKYKKNGAGTPSYDYLNFQYTDPNWKDLLTKVSNHTITHDANGNPLSYYNGKDYTFTWQNGRELASATVGGTTYSYEYDTNGLRTRRTNSGGGYTQYYIVNGIAVAEQKFYANGTLRHTTKYLLDQNNAPVGITVIYPSGDITSYYFAKNAQGDVIGIMNTSGQVLVKYTYDPYGNIISTTNGSGTPIAANAASVANYNPFRYRGYYYDADTELYYLNARYYDPQIGRFLNADDVATIGADESVLSYNLFAYCYNNPVNMTDSNGNLPGWATKLLIGTAVIAVAAVLTVATAGTGTALACFAAGALEGAVSGAVTGAVTGAVGGAISHRISTGSWEGAGKAALEGGATGFMTGAITGFISGGMTSNHCFVAGTAVLTSAGAVAIETIQPGDLVWAWDEETGETSLKPVVETYINETDELIHVHVNGEEIVTTPGHPFYSPVKGWTEAVRLRAGDILVLVNGEYVVVEWIQHELLESPVKVYNFQVADVHTYYVSSIGALVHNLCVEQNNAGAKGQYHHPISNKIAAAAAKNGELAGKVTRAGGGTIRASTLLDHVGYQEWHRTLDNKIVAWLGENTDATLGQFVEKMNILYSTPDMIKRFGQVVFKA